MFCPKCWVSHTLLCMHNLHTHHSVSSPPKTHPIAVLPYLYTYLSASSKSMVTFFRKATFVRVHQRRFIGSCCSRNWSTLNKGIRKNLPRLAHKGRHIIWQQMPLNHCRVGGWNIIYRSGKQLAYMSFPKFTKHLNQGPQ